MLPDEEILQLARWACAIEEHYDKPMDIEWAKDGDSGELFIVQARPETVHSQRAAGVLKTYRLTGKGERFLTGLSIGDAIAAGKVCVLRSPDKIDQFEDGSILVHRDDRPGLGTDHEPGRRHHHGPWRTHLACRHRQPRTGDPRDRRDRRGDGRAPPGARGHHVMCRGGSGLCL